MNAIEQSTSAKPFPWVGLIILSITAFFMVTSEFLPTGLLPLMARDFGVSESQIGFLVTLFAGMVVVSSLPLTALTHRYSRKSLVIVVLSVFIVANLVAAIAPNYPTLAIARIIGGMCHGLFWSIVGAYAGHLVTKKQLPRAISITGAGPTAAFIFGVPLVTALGLAVGWRYSFVGIAILQAVMILLVLRFVPPVDHRPPLATGEIALPMRKQVDMRMFLTISIMQATLVIGQYAFYSYIAPFFQGAAGFVETAVVPLLFTYGVAGAVGLALAPLVADRFPRNGLAVSVALVVVGLVAIGLFPMNRPIMISSLVLWGIAFGIAPVIVQARLLHAASARTRDVASAFLNTAYNLGIGGGALIGGIVLDQVRVGVLPLVAAGIMTGCVVLVVVSDSIDWRRDNPARAPA